MSIYLTQDRLLLAEIETASGTEEAPTPAANAVRVSDLLESPNFENVQDDGEVSSNLDVGAPIIGGGSTELGFSVRMKGAGTGGTAPEWGPLLRACAYAETLTTPAVADTAQAGAASTITLAAGESSTDDAYVGMVVRTTGGTGSGQSAVITDYDGTTKVATVAKAWSVVPDAIQRHIRSMRMRSTSLRAQVSKQLPCGHIRTPAQPPIRN